MKIPQAEEQVLKYLWKLKKAYMKDILAAYPDPKPAATTIATLLTRLQKRKAVGYKTHGSVREYFPRISKKEYFSGQIKGVINNFFEGSNVQFASFFTSESNLSDEELEELRRMVDEQIKSRKK